MKKLLGVCMVSLAAATLLTGCRIRVTSSDANGKGATSVNVDSSGVFVQAGDTQISIDGPSFSFSNEEHESKDFSIPDVPADKIDKLTVKSEMGNIIVSVHDEMTITTKYSYKVSGSKDSVCEEIAKDIGLNFDVRENEAYCEPTLDGRTSINSYVHDKYGIGYNVSVNIDIVVPNSISELVVSTSMGDIDVNGYTGTLDAHSSMGNVYANATFAGESSMSSSMGNIKVNLASVQREEAKLSLSTSMGNIEVNGTGMKVDTSALDNDGFNESLTAVFNDTLSVDAETSMGDISVR